MPFLDSLKKYKFELGCILLLLYFLFMELRFKNKIKEHATTGTLEPTALRAIENLGVLAAQLQEGKLKLPGGVEIEGPLTVKGSISATENITTSKNVHFQDAVAQGGVSIHGKAEGQQHALWLKSAPLFVDNIYSTTLRAQTVEVEKSKLVGDENGLNIYHKDAHLARLTGGRDVLQVYTKANGSRPYFYVNEDANYDVY